MKKILLIILGLIFAFVIIVFAVVQIKGWIYINKDNPEPSNKNINFIGKSKGFYVYGKSCQQMGGSVIIASTLNDIFKNKDYISLIRLTPQGKFDWEKKISFASKGILDKMHDVLNKDFGSPAIEILGFDFADNQYSLLLRRFNASESMLYILTLNSRFKLINTQKIKLELAYCSDFNAFMQNGFIHLAYLDKSNKMICQTKILVKDATLEHNAMLFYNQNRLYLNAITSDEADTTASLTAYDSKKGCSFYMYTKTDDLKEYFRTEPTSEFTVLRYIDKKLYGVVREDSLMRIVDLSSLSRPLLVLTVIPENKNFKAKDFQFINGNFYVLMDVITGTSKEATSDVVVLKITPAGEITQQYLMQGKRIDFGCELFPVADKHFVVLGQSFSLRKGKLLKMFATKFPCH